MPTDNPRDINSSQKRKFSKYEIVIIKTLLANELLEKDFLNDKESMNWRQEVDEIFNSPDFDGEKVLANFIISVSYENNERYEQTNFIPEHIFTQIDPHTDKKFLTNGEETLNKIDEVKEE